MRSEIMIPPGYVKNQDGSYSHPSRVRVAADANREHAQQAGALGGEAPKEPKDQGGVAKRLAKPVRPGRAAAGKARPVVRVTITSYRRRLLDDDNLTAGCKGLRDAVAESLGVDDGIGLVEWECLQVLARSEGTLVTIWKL
jgi:hypothetical protein